MHAEFVLIIGVTLRFISVPSIVLEISKSFHLVLLVAILSNTKPFGTCLNGCCWQFTSGCSCAYIIVDIDRIQKQMNKVNAYIE